MNRSFEEEQEIYDEVRPGLEINTGDTYLEIKEILPCTQEASAHDELCILETHNGKRLITTKLHIFHKLTNDDWWTPNGGDA